MLTSGGMEASRRHRKRRVAREGWRGHRKGKRRQSQEKDGDAITGEGWRGHHRRMMEGLLQGKGRM